MLENPGRLIWITNGAYGKSMIYNRANGIICKDETFCFLQRTSSYFDEIAEGKQTHLEQDAFHNIDCNCLCSDMHRLCRPVERIVSWYARDLITSNL